jgi:hypothetical protein
MGQSGNIQEHNSPLELLIICNLTNGLIVICFPNPAHDHVIDTDV